MELGKSADQIKMGMISMVKVGKDQEKILFWKMGSQGEQHQKGVNRSSMNA